MATKIFVGSLPSGSKPEQLRHLFEAFGVVTECDVMNRCGFVHMEKPEMAANAIKALNGTEFKGETINVEPGRIRERNQKPGGIGGAKGGGSRSRGGRNAMLRMQNFDGIDEAAMGLAGIDERTTKDALQLCSAVFEEMNKLLNPDQMDRVRRGDGGMGFPPNFVEDQLGAVLGGMGIPKGPTNRGSRNNRNNALPKPGPMQVPANRASIKNNASQARGVPLNQGNMERGPKQGPNQPGSQARGLNQGNAGRMQNQGFSGRNQNQNAGNAGRAPKQGNVGPIRNEPTRQLRAPAPYNRGGVRPVDNDINFADDVPIVQSARNFANSLASGSQIDRWPANDGNFGGSGGMNRHPMNRNFDEDMPVDNFTDDPPIIINLVTRPSGGGSGMGGGGGGRRGGMDNQHNGGGIDRFQGSNDRFQGGNDRFQGGNNDRFQNNSHNDRFQGGSSNREVGNFVNQDRRGFVLPEKQMFNNTPKFGNQDLRSGGNPMIVGQNNQGNMGGGIRNAGFGNSNVGRQQIAPQNRNIGGGNMVASGGNAMFSRRNNSGGNLDGNNMGNNRMRNDVPDTPRGGNFGVNTNRGMGGGIGGNMNANNLGFNRNSNIGGGNSNLNGPIGGINRNMGGPSPLNNRNMGGGPGISNNRNMGIGLGNTNNRNMGSGLGNNNNANRNMGGNTGNIMNRNNMGGANQMNFKKEFPALTGGQNMNMNNRNGPRQNMMSNRRY